MAIDPPLAPAVTSGPSDSVHQKKELKFHLKKITEKPLAGKKAPLMTFVVSYRITCLYPPLCPLCRFREHLSTHRGGKDLLHCLRFAWDSAVWLPPGWCGGSAGHHIQQRDWQSGGNVCGESRDTSTVYFTHGSS